MLFSPFHFWRQLILDANIPFQTRFFKLQSWWSWCVPTDFIYNFNVLSLELRCFCTYFRDSLQALPWDINTY